MLRTVKMPRLTAYDTDRPDLRQARDRLIINLAEHTPRQHASPTAGTPLADDDEMLVVILDRVRTLLHAEGVLLASWNGENQETIVELAHGIWSGMRGHQVHHATDLTFSLAPAPYNVVCVPLVAQGTTIGNLCISCAGNITETDLRILEALGAIAANALQHRQRVQQERQTVYNLTLEGWVHALELRDNETEEHTRRVTEMSVSLARALGMGEQELVHVRRGALLHDIGKIAIPDSILLKPGPLTEEEWHVMRQHPLHAYSMLAPIPFLQPALAIPLFHHEKWDGTGYPYGLQGTAIPWAARIFAVVDVWDALRFDRPYRKAWSEKRVRTHIASLAGTHFDPEIVSVFLRHSDEHPSIFLHEIEKPAPPEPYWRAYQSMSA